MAFRQPGSLLVKTGKVVDAVSTLPGKGGEVNYYNDNDPKICAWLRELINQKLIPDGVVDSRSIELIKPDELKPYTQCHFFAGIGGWPEALRLAGWPTNVPVWTGSCPCQPYSCAGKGKGNDDPRNVWPHFRRLIEAAHPPVVFGEQVASKAGREWLSGVFADLEALGYSRAGADLCAASVGAPHIRQRLYWVADSKCSPGRASIRPGGCNGTEKTGTHAESGRCGDTGGLDNAANDRPEGGAQLHGEHDREISGNGCNAGRVVDPISQRGCCGESGRSNATHAWKPSQVIPCRDGKQRRTQSGVCPLAHGVPARVVRLRGYGNAIVPQVAAEFIGAYMDINPLPL